MVVRLHFVHRVELHRTMVLPPFLIYRVGQHQKKRYGLCGVQHDGRIGCLKQVRLTARIQILLLARVVIKVRSFEILFWLSLPSNIYNSSILQYI